MFRKSRRKIILSIMGSLILLFAVTLSVILLASSREIRQRNEDMLERYAELYSLEQQENPDEPAPFPPPENENVSAPDQDKQQRENKRDDKRRMMTPDNRSDFKLATFYSVAVASDGTVLAVDNGEKDIYSEDDLISLAEDILAKGSSSGKTDDHLSYLVTEKAGYRLVAFMDDRVTESSLQTVKRNILIVGSIAIVVLFFISLLLAKRIIRPLEESDRQQKQFVSDASHELKTPVAVIGTNAEMLSREIGNNEWLGNICYENERMGELVKQLLDLSRAESAEIQTEPVDFSRVVTGEALSFDTLAFDQGKIIQSDIDDGIILQGNKTQLTQIVSVLLDNAIRHSTGREIVVLLKRQGHHAVLSVANDGDEIPPEKQAHLFDRFYRVDEARNSDGQHYGLGLSIAKAAAERHGGAISVSCGDGKVGFTVSLPIKK